MTTPQQLLDQLSEAERTAPVAPADARARVWDQVQARLEGGPAPPELDSAPLVEAAASKLPLKLLAALLVVGAGGGLAWVGLSGRAAPEPSAGVEAPAGVVAPVEPAAPSDTGETATSRPAAPPDLPAADETDASDEPDTPAAAPAGVGRKRRPPVETEVEQTKPGPAKTLADELALMQALSTALKQGDSSRARALVAEHERAFPSGQFIEEREAAGARALCQSGRVEAGRKRGQRFVSRWPASIHRSAVEAECGKI